MNGSPAVGLLRAARLVGLVAAREPACLLQRQEALNDRGRGACGMSSGCGARYVIIDVPKVRITLVLLARWLSLAGENCRQAM